MAVQPTNSKAQRIFEHFKDLFKSPDNTPEAARTPGDELMYRAQQNPAISTTFSPTPQTLGAQYSSGDINYDEIANKIKKKFIDYGGDKLPALEVIPAYIDAMKKYQFFRDNPYLIPQQMLLETSGGKYVTRPNNLLNWGINYPGNNESFAQMSPREVLDRALSGIGERSNIYSQYRTGKPLSTEEIKNYAKTYEPANPNYGDWLINGISSY